MVSRTIAFMIYIIKYFLLDIVCPLIPHPKLRSVYLKALGAEIGRNVRIENIKFIQIQCSLKHFRCRDNVFIGTGVIIDLSSIISIGSNSLVSPCCCLITHQDAGEFFDSQLNRIYPRKYSPVIIKEDVWIGCDTTILPGITIGSFTVVSAKSLVRDNIPDHVLAAGIPAKVIKHLKIDS